MSQKDASLTLRLRSEIKTALEEAARDEQRTMSNLAEILIEEGLRLRGKKAKRAR